MHDGRVYNLPGYVHDRRVYKGEGYMHDGRVHNPPGYVHDCRVYRVTIESGRGRSGPPPASPR